MSFLFELLCFLIRLYQALSRRGACVQQEVKKLIAPGLLAMTLAGLAINETATAASSYATSAKGQAFIEEMEREHQFSRADLNRWLGSTSRYEAVLTAMSKPAEKMLTWKQYRPIFIKQGRIDAALKFARTHAVLLDSVEQAYGIPREIIVAIIGVESLFGQHKGKHPALSTLATLAFDYPKRAVFFRRELKEFLLLAREEGFDPLAVKGSYAAAMGMPQFISSSYRAYAVDGDGDGKRDLFGSTADICASVANYFSSYGWRSDGPVAQQVQVRGDVSALVGKGYKPELTASDFKKAGIDAPLYKKDRAALIELKGSQGLEHWVVHHNFYVITRYNHSPLYAMAVFQLAQSITQGLASTD